LPIDAKLSGEGARDARDRLSIPLQEATGQQDAPFPLAPFSSPSPQPPAFAEGEVQLRGGRSLKGGEGVEMPTTNPDEPKVLKHFTSPCTIGF